MSYSWSDFTSKSHAFLRVLPRVNDNGELEDNLGFKLIFKPANSVIKINNKNIKFKKYNKKIYFIF
jgi:hypothetical protein